MKGFCFNLISLSDSLNSLLFEFGLNPETLKFLNVKAESDLSGLFFSLELSSSIFSLLTSFAIRL